MAGRFGNSAQTDYAAANDLLCKTTSAFRTTRPSTKGYALDWTAWGGIGMATRGSVATIMDALGVGMLPPEVGVAWIRRELTAGTPAGEVVVANSGEHDLAWLAPTILTVITASTSLLLAALGELVVEKAGVLNLGVEGMMISPGYNYSKAPDQDHFLKRQQTINLSLTARPLQLDVDPEFDIFRRLHRNEIPPAVSQAMGAEQVLVILPGKASADLARAYRALATRWQQEKPGHVDIVVDSDVQTLPDDRAVWLFGWQNSFRPQLNAALQGYDFTPGGNSVRIAGTTLSAQSHSLAVLGRQPNNPDQALGWLAADTAAALPGLGRKLPHYGRYSYLGFSGTNPDNMLKGQWPVVNSPMSVRVHQEDAVSVSFSPAALAPRKALVAPAEPFSVERMRQDIAFLAHEDLAGRGLGTAQLDRAADYIAQQFRTAGLQPGGDDGSYFQTWQQPVEPQGTAVTLKNVVAVLPGSDPRHAGQSLVIGAHYDHLGRGENNGRQQDRGQLHPGADDNASGIAVMLELARSLEGKPLPRTLLFIAFTGEENGKLGSRHYIRHSDSYPAEDIIAMLNLDTVGRLEDQPLILFGTGTADEWVHIFRGAGYVTGVPVKAVASTMTARPIKPTSAQ